MQQDSLDQLVWHSESIKVLMPGGNFGVEYLAEPDVSFAVAIVFYRHSFLLTSQLRSCMIPRYGRGIRRPRTNFWRKRGKSFP